MAEATFVSSGASIDYTPGGAVVAGQVIEQVNLIGIATQPIAANVAGSLQVEGVFDFVKTATLVVNVGDPIYWDDTANEANKTSASNMLIGKAVRASAAADTTVRVKLDQ
jgi:predicted RecA/RadA family phage recombinase